MRKSQSMRWVGLLGFRESVCSKFVSLLGFGSGLFGIYVHINDCCIWEKKIIKNREIEILVFLLLTCFSPRFSFFLLFFFFPAPPSLLPIWTKIPYPTAWHLPLVISSLLTISHRHAVGIATLPINRGGLGWGESPAAFSTVQHNHRRYRCRPQPRPSLPRPCQWVPPWARACQPTPLIRPCRLELPPRRCRSFHRRPQPQWSNLPETTSEPLPVSSPPSPADVCFPSIPFDHTNGKET